MAESTTGYPILLNLEDRQVVVVGGGMVATRKVHNLLTAGARVLVISPEITPKLQTNVDVGQIEWVKALYQRDMLNTYMPLLVIATTDDARVNQTVAQDAHRIRAWVNIADGNRNDSDFSNMAVVHHPPLIVALGTNGTSPALLRHLKDEIRTVLGDEYAILAEWMGTIRQPLKDEVLTQSQRHHIYQQVLESDVLALLRDGNHDAARMIFQQIIGEGVLQ